MTLCTILHVYTQIKRKSIVGLTAFMTNCMRTGNDEIMMNANYDLNDQ